jgi:hypothetical protein
MRIVSTCLIASLIPIAVLATGCAVAPEGPSSHSLDETEGDGGAPSTSNETNGGSGVGGCDGGTCAHPHDAGRSGTDGGRGSVDSGAGASCDENNACQTAHDLGAVQGDKGSDSVSATGSGSTWLKVRATEADSSLIGHPMILTVTLNSPADEKFDLYVYGNPDADTVECSSVMGQSVGQSPATASLKWGELGYWANDKDDSRTISIEVRSANANTTCDPNEKWNLTVKGNASN